MARLPRFFVPGEALQAIQRGNNREPVFAAETDPRFFLDRLSVRKFCRQRGKPPCTSQLPNHSNDPITDDQVRVRRAHTMRGESWT